MEGYAGHRRRQFSDNAGSSYGLATIEQTYLRDNGGGQNLMLSDAYVHGTYV